MCHIHWNSVGSLNELISAAAVNVQPGHQMTYTRPTNTTRSLHYPEL